VTESTKGIWVVKREPVLLLAVGVVASGTLLLVLGSRLTFLLDDWEFLLYRRGFTEQAVLSPHGEHIVIGPVLVYKALLATFGMTSALPFRFVSTTMFLLGAALLFVYLRRRIDPWLALIGTTVILFLGPAWEDLLWSFQVGFLTAMAAGLGALLALERGDRRGDRLACLLLVVSIVFSSLGIPFAVGAAVATLRGRDRWRRLYVVLVPLAVYAAWWLGWGHTAESALSWKNLATTPQFVLDGLAAAFASLLGLATPVEGVAAGGLDWGRPLVVGAATLAAWRLHRLGKVPEWLWVTFATAGAFWILAGLNEKPGRDPTSSRYQYVGAIFVLLLAAELLRGLRVRKGALVVAGIVAVAALISNVYLLAKAYESYKSTSDLERADLGAVEIARDTVEPGFTLEEEIADTAYVHVDAASYFSAADEFGSPAYTPAELLVSPEPARFAADKVLFNALRIVLTPVATPAVMTGKARAASPNAEGLVVVPPGVCVAVPDGSTAPLLSLPPTGVVIESGAQPVTDIKMKRFATYEFSVDFEAGVAPGRPVAIKIPPDRSTVPWKMQLEGGPATVCGLGRETG